MSYWKGGEKQQMIKAIALGILTLVFSLTITAITAHAQTVTSTTTVTPSPTSKAVPGAPNTGFGN